MHPPVYLSIYPVIHPLTQSSSSLRIHFHSSLYLLISPFVYPPISLPTHPPNHLSIHPITPLATYSQIHLSILHLSISLSIHPPIQMPAGPMSAQHEPTVAVAEEYDTLSIWPSASPQVLLLTDYRPFMLWGT